MNRFFSLCTALILVPHCAPPPAETEACVNHSTGELRITELMIDPEGADVGAEWIELFNPSSKRVDLSGLTLYLQNTDGSGKKTHLITGGEVAPRGYWTLGDVRSSESPNWVNYSYAASLGSMPNTGGTVGLRCDQTTIAQLTYDRTIQSGRSLMLDGLEDISGESMTETRFCDASDSNMYAAGNAGTPGISNPPCSVEKTGTCIENGTARPIHFPRPGDFIITEVMTSPTASGDSSGEWLELLAQGEVDLNDLRLTTTTSSTRIESSVCLPVTTGEYVLLARSADPFVNGALPNPHFVYDSVSWTDTTNQRIALFAGDAGLVDEVALLTPTPGRSWQLDPRKTDSIYNDDPAQFCVAKHPWKADGGGDFGSPGEANPDCTSTQDTSLCIDPLTTMMRAPRHPVPGELVITEWMSNPGAIPDAAGEYVELLAKQTFDLNGLSLRVGTTTTPLVSPNCIQVTANSYFIFGKNSDPLSNGNLPTLRATFGGALTASSTVSMLAADGTVLDSITANGETSGASMQMRPGSETTDANDNPLNRCATPEAVRYGTPLADGGMKGNRGTPGQPNVTCP